MQILYWAASGKANLNLAKPQFVYATPNQQEHLILYTVSLIVMCMCLCVHMYISFQITHMI